MAWTEPRTWVSQEVPTDAQFNAHIKDNLNYLKTTLDALNTSGISSVLSRQVTPAGVPNVGVGETTLFSYVVPANMLSANGMALRVTVEGSCVANANFKAFRLRWGASEPWWSGNVVVNGQSFTMRGWIIREGVGDQLAFTKAVFGVAAPAVALQACDRENAAEDETANVTLAFTGSSPSGGNQLFAYSMLVELLTPQV